MGLALEARGHTDHRRSDAGALRLLLAFDLSVGELGRRLGVTRQAGRKLADGLVARGYARFERDASDARIRRIGLTPSGRAYASAVIEVIEDLDADLAGRADPGDLAAAERVLRLVITSERARTSWPPTLRDDLG